MMIGTTTRICTSCLGSRLAFQTALRWIQLRVTQTANLPDRKRDHSLGSSLFPPRSPQPLPLPVVSKSFRAIPARTLRR